MCFLKRRNATVLAHFKNFYDILGRVRPTYDYSLLFLYLFTIAYYGVWRSYVPQ